MIKRVTVDYQDVSPRDIQLAMRVVVDHRALCSDNDRRDFANMLDETVALAVAKWEVSRV